MMRKFQDFTFEKDSDTLPFSPYYDIFGGELYFSPRKSLPNFDCSPQLQLIVLNPKPKFLFILHLQSYTFCSSLSRPHPLFFTLSPKPSAQHLQAYTQCFSTLNLTPFILHSGSFNFQPYSRGRSLTSKKPFLSIIITKL